MFFFFFVQHSKGVFMLCCPLPKFCFLTHILAALCFLHCFTRCYFPHSSPSCFAFSAFVPYLLQFLCCSGPTLLTVAHHFLLGLSCFPHASPFFFSYNCNFIIFFAFSVGHGSWNYLPVHSFLYNALSQTFYSPTQKWACTVLEWQIKSKETMTTTMSWYIKVHEWWFMHAPTSSHWYFLFEPGLFSIDNKNVYSFSWCSIESTKTKWPPHRYQRLYTYMFMHSNACMHIHHHTWGLTF